MKVNFNVPLLDFNNNEVMESGLKLQLKDLVKIFVIRDLNSNDLKDIILVGNIQEKINSNDEIELTINEAKFIQDKIQSVDSINAFYKFQIYKVLNN